MTEPQPSEAPPEGTIAHDGMSDILRVDTPPARTTDHAAGPTISHDDTLPEVPGYAVTAEIARGGMGVVYAAYDGKFEREVAIKVLLPGANAERFITESKITARLPHPGIPPVYDLGTQADGSPFLAMKLIRGLTLDALRASVPPDLPRFVQIFEQIAQAVGFAHSQDVIHRDLKPGNIMVGGFGEVQVMDWGLAKQLARELASGRREPTVLGGDIPVTEQSAHAGHVVRVPGFSETIAGTVMGTPAYLAPEQARGEVVDARADVFALGGILCYLLTGKPPFQRATQAQTVKQAAAGDVAEAMNGLNICGADAELVSLAKVCLAPVAADRPADGLAVAALVSAYRAGVETRLRKAETDRAAALATATEQRKRRRVVQVAAGLVAAVLVVGIIGTTVGLVRASNARDDETLRAEGERLAKLDAEAQTAKATAATKAETAAKLHAEAQTAKAIEATKAETAAKRLAEVDRDRATQRYSLASDALGQVVFAIQDKLKDRPGALELRQALLSSARTALQKLLADAEKDRTPDRTLAAAHQRMGDVELALGNTQAASTEYQSCRRIAQVLADADPKNAMAQRDLGVSFERLGEVSLLLGRTKDALDFYKKSLAIRQTLADVDPKNAEAQRDLSVGFGKLGDVNLQLGQTKDALDFFNKSLAISQSLANVDLKNAQAQSDLSIGFNNLGDVSLQLGQTQNALDFYKKGLVVSQSLADADPKNAQAQRDLGVSFNKLGDVSLQLNQTKDALDFYKKYNQISQTLADADPKNAQAQRDLSVSFINLGDVSLQLDQTKDALDFYKKYNQISQTLADADSKNAEAQRGLSISFDRLGNVSLKLGQTKDALDFYKKSLAIRQTLAEADPKNAEAQRDLSISFDRLGDVTLQLGQTKDALDFYKKYNQISQTLADADPKNAQAQRDFLVSYFKIGSLNEEQKQFANAIEWYEKAMAVAKKFERPEFFAAELKELEQHTAICKKALVAMPVAPPPREAKP